MIGETVGNFQIVSRLGRGGMGEVWLAEQVSVRTRVAIKMLHADISTNTTLVQRFFNEAVAAGQIRHAGIAKIFDVGWTASGRAYFVMEYLDGETLAARIARGPLPLRQVADLGRQIASVLDATHSAGIVHRDLKPDNIFIVADAELASKERVKVLDFGIAKLSSNPGLTAASVSSVGTPHYMSPEQWHSLAEVDWRSDAYALGCVAFEMACGRVPFPASSLGEACELHLVETPPVPSSLRRELPPAFDALIARLLDKEPAPRPSMDEAMAVFAGMVEGRAVALAPAVPTPTPGHGLPRATVVQLAQMWDNVPARTQFASSARSPLPASSAPADTSGYFSLPAEAPVPGEPRRPSLPPTSGSASRAVEMLAQPATPSQEVSALPPGALGQQHVPTMIVEPPRKGGGGMIVAVIALVVGTVLAVVAVLYLTRKPEVAKKSDDKAGVKADKPEARPAEAKPEAKKADPWAGSAKPPRPDKRKPQRRSRAPVDVPVPASDKFGVLGLEADVRADIEIDGAPLGRRTPEVIDLPAGKHTVRVYSRDLGLEDVFEIDIQPNTMHPVFVEFLPSDAAGGSSAGRDPWNPEPK